MTKAVSLIWVVFRETDWVAGSLSRVAIIARPVRLRRRLTAAITTRARITSEK